MNWNAIFEAVKAIAGKVDWASRQSVAAAVVPMATVFAQLGSGWWSVGGAAVAVLASGVAVKLKA